MKSPATKSADHWNPRTLELISIDALLVCFPFFPLLPLYTYLKWISKTEEYIWLRLIKTSNSTARFDRTCSTTRRLSIHHRRIQKYNNDCNVIMKMSPHSSINLLQVGVSHFSFLCSYSKCTFDKSPSNSLQMKKRSLDQQLASSNWEMHYAFLEYTP